MHRRIECYLTLQKRISYWSDRKKWIETPLFPSYIFVNVNNKDYSRVFACPHILKYVSFEGQPLPVPTDQLNLIKAVIRSDMNYVAIKENFKKGDRVKLLEGPLADYYGVVMTYSGKENIVISLENIGYALLINMPAECMAAANTL